VAWQARLPSNRQDDYETPNSRKHDRRLAVPSGNANRIRGGEKVLGGVITPGTRRGPNKLRIGFARKFVIEPGLALSWDSLDRN
jgi:hypothetical protein